MACIDVVVFASGIGENSPRVRASICENLSFMGLKLDLEKDDECVAKEG